MARDPSEIRDEIERTRGEIAASLTHLRSSMTEATDWKVHVRRRPLTSVGLAFALGLLIAVR
jgi:ElaB/YqjD/DUF883 family membrane-anchored ribosome-binding protein